MKIMQEDNAGRSLMYGRQSAGPKMEPWGTSELIGYSCEDFPSRTTQNHLFLRKDEKRPNIGTRNSVRLKFVKKTSNLNPAEIFGYIKYYSLGSSRPIKSLNNSIRYNRQRVCKTRFFQTHIEKVRW